MSSFQQQLLSKPASTPATPSNDSSNGNGSSNQQPGPSMLKRDYGKYLVDLTRQHKRFHQAYTRMWTQPDDEGPWIEATRTRGPEGSSTFSPRFVGMDCEMVETEGNANAPARVTIVALANMAQGVYPCQPQVLLDEFIKPPSRVVDFRTEVSGVTADDIENAPSLHEVQQHILQVVCRDTVLVGHALNFDLAALRLRHENVVDTSFLYRVDAMNGRVFALRDVVAEVFGQDCQPVGQAHDCLLDALWPLELVRFAIDTIASDDKTPLFDPAKKAPIVHDVFRISLPSEFFTRMEIVGVPSDMTQDSLLALLGSHGCTASANLFTKFNPGDARRSGMAKLQFGTEEAVVEAFLKLPIEHMHQTSDVSFVKQLILPSREILKTTVYLSKPNSKVSFQVAQAKAQRDAVAPLPFHRPPPPALSFSTAAASAASAATAAANGGYGGRGPMGSMFASAGALRGMPRMTAAMSANQRQQQHTTPIHAPRLHMHMHMQGRGRIPGMGGLGGRLRQARATQPQGFTPPKPAAPSNPLGSPAFF